MNNFGQNFRLSLFGQSHGKAIGITLDGVPCGIELKESDFLADLNRRKSGKIGSTSRIETDIPVILSGVYNGYTSGDPLTVIFENTNILSEDYQNLQNFPRPSHADFASKIKFKGFANPCGGGHFSGRLTLGLVVAGVVAKKIVPKIKFDTKIISIGGEKKDFKRVIQEAMKKQDSLGGKILCTIQNVPIGLGEPFFYSIESAIAALAFSIPAIKAISFGAGDKVASRAASENNDLIIDSMGTTATNNDGGITGGLSNGNQIKFSCHIKPTPSIARPQKTFNFDKSKIDILEIKGRHDACIATRAAVVIEAIGAIALADMSLF